MQQIKMNVPCIPLVTIDPYCSLWSKTKELNKSDIVHWSLKKRTLIGEVLIDGESFRFMGLGDTPEIVQRRVDVFTFSSVYIFANEKIELKIKFISPALITDLYLISRPVSYITATYKSLDGDKHNVSVKISASEEHCIDGKGTEAVVAEKIALDDGITAIKIGSVNQDVLNKSGDEIGINWGYLYLAVKYGEASPNNYNGMKMISISAVIKENENTVFTLAYDDIYSVEYFGEKLIPYWKKDNKDIDTAIVEAINGYDETIIQCNDFANKMITDAINCGGEKYADLLALSYRQILAAHKLVIDTNGKILYISKECSSNGCAATVDITYPTSPIFLLYNSELLKASILPVMNFVENNGWKYDFAPHDIGCYPKLNGQVYSDTIDRQMPVEECGNMLILFAAIAKKDKNADFARPYIDTMSKWVKYLVEYGNDPGDQLCTDDFAGQLAHNCNLSVKAIMGIASYSLIMTCLGRDKDAEKYMSIAKTMALNFQSNASNGDGSLRLAFDKPDSFSMKYNIIWDKIFGTQIFNSDVIRNEFLSYFKRFNKYGLPLDSRKGYSKSDWLLWCASLAENKEEFIRFITPLWNFYNDTKINIPMTDWYETETSKPAFWRLDEKEESVFAFKHRSVQGGLFIRMLLKELLI